MTNMADATPPRRRKLDTQRNRRAKYIPRAWYGHYPDVQ